MHQTCAVDEHYSIGTSENAVGRLRETSIALLLQANLPSKYWPCAIQHSAFLSNYTSRSRAKPKLTVYELIYQQKADMSKIPPFGAYCTVYRARDQRQGNLDLSSTPGIFVGVGIYQKTLGYMVTDTTLNKLTVTYPLTLNCSLSVLGPPHRLSFATFIGSPQHRHPHPPPHRLSLSPLTSKKLKVLHSSFINSERIAPTGILRCQCERRAVQVDGGNAESCRSNF